MNWTIGALMLFLPPAGACLWVIITRTIALGKSVGWKRVLIGWACIGLAMLWMTAAFWLMSP